MPDTLRTHIIGVLDRHPEWAAELAPFQAEAAWTIGDWATVRNIQNPPPIANVFLAIQSGQDIPAALQLARRQIGNQITTREYARVYDAVLQLHMIHEVEMIHSVDTKASTAGHGYNSQNAAAIARRQVDDLVARLSDRFQVSLQSFRVREEVLNKRRAAFNLVQTARLKPELGQAWIQSAKIARKAGYEQTAYSAALQAHVAEAPFAFIQQAKLVRAQGGILKALRELEYPIKRLLRESEEMRSGVIDLTESGQAKSEDDFRRDRSLAKVSAAVDHSNARLCCLRRVGFTRRTVSSTTMSSSGSRRPRSSVRRWRRRSSISVDTMTHWPSAQRTCPRWRRTTTLLVSTTVRRCSMA